MSDWNLSYIDDDKVAHFEYSVCFYDADDILAAAADIQEVVATGSDVTFHPWDEGCGGYLRYARLATPEEITAKAAERAKYQRESAERERAQYEALRRKFG